MSEAGRRPGRGRNFQFSSHVGRAPGKNNGRAGVQGTRSGRSLHFQLSGDGITGARAGAQFSGVGDCVPRREQKAGRGLDFQVSGIACPEENKKRAELRAGPRASAEWRGCQRESCGMAHLTLS